MSAITREIVNAFRFEVQCNVELANSYEYLRAENQKLQIRISELENQGSNLTAGQGSPVDDCVKENAWQDPYGIWGRAAEEAKSGIRPIEDCAKQEYAPVEISKSWENPAIKTTDIRWDEKTKKIRQAHSPAAGNV